MASFGILFCPPKLDSDSHLNYIKDCHEFYQILAMKLLSVNVKQIGVNQMKSRESTCAFFYLAVLHFDYCPRR